jgi:ABC-type branched-subunit amino acid transport system permease subunit
VAAKVLVFVVLVASFDLLLGYTGIVSFAHTMFFGIGAYGIAMASTRWGRPGRRWPSAWVRRWCCRSGCRWRWVCSRCGCARSSSP